MLVFQKKTGVGSGQAYDIINVDKDSATEYATGLSVPTDLAFNNDGTKMYVTAWAASVPSTPGYIRQYSLSNPWDITSATVLDTEVLVNNERQPHGIFFKPDGTSVYITEAYSDKVFQYSMSVAWDTSTISYVNATPYLGTGGHWSGLYIKSDGMKMYVNLGPTLHQFSLSTPWDVSTWSNDAVTAATGYTDSYGLVFKPDGTTLFTVKGTGTRFRQFTLSTPWLISSATLDYEVPSVSRGIGLTLKPDGTAIYDVANHTNKVYQYST